MNKWWVWVLVGGFLVWAYLINDPPRTSEPYREDPGPGQELEEWPR